jgi:hypothetical protein
VFQWDKGKKIVRELETLVTLIIACSIHWWNADLICDCTYPTTPFITDGRGNQTMTSLTWHFNYHIYTQEKKEKNSEILTLDCVRLKHASTFAWPPEISIIDPIFAFNQICLETLDMIKKWEWCAKLRGRVN